MSEVHLELITHLSHGLGLRAFLFDEHPRVAESAEAFVQELRRTLAQLRRSELFLGVAEGRLVHEGRFLIGATLLGRRVTRLAERLHCGGFLFKSGVDARQLLELFATSVDSEAAPESLAAASAQLAAKGVHDIVLSPAYEEQDWYGQFAFEGDEVRGAVDPDEEALARAVPVYQSLFECVEVAHGRAENDHEIDIDGTRAVSELLLSSTREGYMDLLRCVRYPNYDSYTVGHSVRVALFAVMVAERLGMPPEFLIELGTAGLLHDVGKAKIPHEILYKRGRLDEEERRIMARHPELGAEILLEHSAVEPLSVGCAFGHHTRYDGGGYPLPRSWAARGPVTELVTVCDVFEALTAVRPYKPAYSPHRTFEIMLADKGAFAPAALDALVRTLGFYPPGSPVRLSNGEHALVLQAGRHPGRPRLRRTHDAAGVALAGEDRLELELDSADARSVRIEELLGDLPVEPALPRLRLEEPVPEAPPDDACCR